MTDIDITPHDLETVKRLVASYFPDVEARVFGSRYRWTAKDYSDLDIALVGSEKLDWYKVNQLREALAESDLPFRVDVLDWHAISPEFQRVIAAGYVVIQLGKGGNGGGLGMSSNNWETCKLGDVCVKIGSGATPRGGKEVYSDEGPVALIRSQNVLDFSFSYDGLAYIDENQANQLSNVEIESDDVLLNITGDSVARVCQVTDDLLPARVNQHVAIIRPDNTKMNATYLKYYLLNPRFKSHMLALASVGGTRKALTKGMIEGFDIALPPLATQKRIAGILSALDEKMELNRQTNATLEAIAQAIFREWFVQFNYPGATGDLVESELGLIPVGWRVQPLPEMIEINPSRMLKKGDIAPYLDMANMPTEGHRGIEWVDRAYSSGTKFVNGDTLLAKITPCLENGKTAFVDFLANGQTGWGSTEFIVLHPKPPLPPEYGYYLARSDALRNHAIQNMIGTSGRQRTPISSFESFLMVIPPEHIAVQFGEIASSVLAQVRAFDEESRTLAQIRNALLPRLMRGEV